jgi:uncharacterized membrane protein YphA (DoxX/SURF4 family)
MTKIVGWILSGLLAIFFLLSGYADVIAGPIDVERYTQYGFPMWSVAYIGVIEIVAGFAVVVPRMLFLGVAMVFVIEAVTIATYWRFEAHAFVAYPWIALFFVSLAAVARRPSILPIRRRQKAASAEGGA